MTVFVKATKPSAPKNPRAVQIALVYVGILVVLAVTQLYSFDQFLIIVRDYVLPGGEPTAYFLAGLIVIAEVLALPFLLRMQLSTAMRYVSMAMGWLVAAFWLLIALWLVATKSNVTNIGLFGDVVRLAPGWLSIGCGLGLGVLSAEASYGLWPRRSHK